MYEPSELCKAAIALSKKSPMQHTAKVGAILQLTDGSAIGCHNKGSEQLEVKDKSGQWQSHPSVLHAEEACIAIAAKRGLSTKEATLVVTHAPCYRCARLIVACGIAKVYYAIKWWDKDAVEYLRRSNITVIRLRKIPSA